MKKIVLIGGAPMAGKSTLAKRLSEELRLPWISTDTIREMMRNIVRPEDYPGLFKIDYEEDGSAEKYLPFHTPQEIVDDQNLESKDVWKAVESLIKTEYVWQNFIIEGVALLPEFLSRINLNDAQIKPIFLVDEDTGRMRQTAFSRGLWDDASTYPDSLKEIEVQWVNLFNQWIKNEAQKYNYPVFIINQDRSYIEKCIKEIRDWLSA